MSNSALVHDDKPIAARAVVYGASGGTEVIQFGSRMVRPPLAHEVRIKVVAAAVNPTDILLREGARNDTFLPTTPGMDASGTIQAVGAEVSNVAVGDEVMAVVSPGRAEGGAQAEYIVVPAASVVRKPHNSTLRQAATLPMNGLTAFYALDLAALAPGQTIAVTGGAGVLAHYTIAAAKDRGLVVIADAKPSEAGLVRGYGADIVVDRGERFADDILRHVPGGVDALLDTALLAEASFPALRSGGVYIPVRRWSGKPTPRDIVVRPVLVTEVITRTDWLEATRRLVEAGRLSPVVFKEYGFDQVDQAQAVLAAGGVRGRPVLVW